MATKKKFSVNVFKIVVMLFLIFYVVTMMAPLVWGLLVSFMDQTQYIMNPLALPEVWHFENYLLVVMEFSVPVGDSLLYIETTLVNSLLYAVGCSVINTFIICITAYACAKFDFWYCRMIEKIVIVVLVVPIVGNLPSELQMSKMFGLYDSILGMYVMRSSFLGMYFLVFRAMFKGIPDDYRDAAYIDGASNWSVMFKIMFPMISQTFKTIVLLLFIGYWNDYQTPLLYLPSHPPLALGLFYFNNSTQNNIATEPIKLAACFLLFIPILILFIFTNEKLMGNLQMGGLKG